MKKYMSRMFLIVSVLSMIMVLTGCSSNKTGDTPALEGKPIQSVVENEVETEEGVVEDSDLLVESDGSYESIEELFRNTDLNWNQSESYSNAVSAFGNSIGKATFDTLDSVFGADRARFSVAYMDEDAIPELLCGLGDNHPCGIHVFKYDADTDSVVWVGEFGSYGNMSFSEKKNRIYSSYGNNGLFHSYISKIEGGKPVLVDVLCKDGNGLRYDGEAYFHNPSLPDYTGTRTETGEDPDYYDDYNDNWKITEEEFKRIESEAMLAESVDWVSVRYKSMSLVKLKDDGDNFK